MTSASFPFSSLKIPLVPALTAPCTVLDAPVSLTAPPQLLISSMLCPQRDNYSSHRRLRHRTLNSLQTIQVIKATTSVLTACTQRIAFPSPLPGEVHICLRSVKMRLPRPWALVLPGTALFEVDHWSRTGIRECIAAFTIFVWSEKENIQ